VRAEDNPFRIETVGDVARNRQVSHRQARVERAGFRRQRELLGDRVGLQLAGHRTDAWRRLDGHLAAALLLPPLPERPFETVATRGAAVEPQAWRLEEIGQRRQIDIPVRDIPHRTRRHALLSERRQPVVESRGASEQPAGRVGDVQPIRQP